MLCYWLQTAGHLAESRAARHGGRILKSKSFWVSTFVLLDNTKDVNLHKEICLVRFWVRWSPKYALFGSYKRSKIPLRGSLCVFYKVFGGPLLPVLTLLLTDLCRSVS